MEIKSDFNGFGPLPTSKPTFAQGTGINSSFAPIWTKDPELSKKESYNKKVTPADTSSFPWKLVPTTEDVGGIQEPRVLVTYGEVDGTAPSGMTLGTDYILDVGSAANTIIYLILTFDGNGLMDSVTIGYDTTLPDNTDSTKHMPIGVVSLVDDVYEINEQALTQYVYTEQALYINNSTEGLVYSLFADPRKIHIINDLENFVVDIDGENNISKLYLENNSHSEYIELKKDTHNGVVAVDGFSGTGGQNFQIKCDDANGNSVCELYDANSQFYIHSRIDSNNSKTSVYGYSNNESHNFNIIADSDNELSAVQIYDGGNSYYMESKVDTANAITSLYGYGNSGDENFKLVADSQNQISALSLYDGDSATYLETKVDTTNLVSSVYGYSANETYNFKIAADGNADKSFAAVYGQDSNVYSAIATEAGKASVYGYADNETFNYKMSADQNDNKSSVEVYGQNSNVYTQMATEQGKASVYGYADNETFNYLIRADQNANKSSVSVYGQNSNVYAELVTESGKASVWGYSDNETEEFVLKAKDGETMLYLKGGGKEVTIDIPDNNGTLLDAKWQEIDVCVDGQLKKMKVLGTDPYDPPA